MSMLLATYFILLFECHYIALNVLYLIKEEEEEKKKALLNYSLKMSKNKYE